MKPLSLKNSILWFGIPSVYFWLIAYFLIPWLNTYWMLHPALSWFICGYLIFIPLFVAACIGVRRENIPKGFYIAMLRLRLIPLSPKDWKYTVGGILLIFILTFSIMLIYNYITNLYGYNKLNTSPPFMEFSPFTIGQRWMLLVWLPMFIFNIVGEEILWRGYLLPRQQLYFGQNAWWINSVLWGIFHVCFGWQLLILLSPILIVLPYIVFKTQNTTTGIIIHAVLNGPMFVVVSLGLMPA